jgi:hypothetical protein
MRKIIINLIIICFISVIAYLFIRIGEKLQDRKHFEKQISKLPSFSFTTLQNESFDSFQITEGPLLIVRFHPDCEHCKYEVSELLKNNILKSRLKILLVSNADRDTVIKFLDQFSFSDGPEVIPLIDTAYSFGDIFGSDIVPSNYIYNKDLKLVKILYGEVKTEAILKYMD